MSEQSQRERSRRTRRMVLVVLLISGVASLLWLGRLQHQAMLNRALVNALKQEDVKQAIQLVENGADPNASCYEGPVTALDNLQTLLMHRYITDISHPTAIEMVCGDPRFKGNTPIFFKPDAPALVEAMLKHGARLQPRSGNMSYLLKSAATSDHPRTVALLLEHGVPVDGKDSGGYTVLMYANRSPEIERMLLAKGAHVNAQKQDGKSVLYAAIDCNGQAFDETIRMLLAHGADPNLPDKTGSTPLTFARQSGYKRIVSLLQQSADKNTINK